MGQVVPFITRVRDSGDWTAGERARLEELADRLAAAGVKVEVIFGATDEGDPWCVVTDESGDVLIHVARIDGAFVVHSAVDDAVNESHDLHTALRDRLAATEELVAPRSATILPFDLNARQGQTFLALVAAAAFFYETAAIGDTAQAAPSAPAPLPAADPPPPDADAPVQEREVAAQATAAQPAQPTVSHTTLAVAAPAIAPAQAAAAEVLAPVATEDQPLATPVAETPAAAPAEAAPRPAADQPLVITGGDSDDLLVGTRADEHILGGGGNDTLRGGGGADTLEGGAGDDRIELAPDAIALGGAGADSFVLQPTPHPAHPDLLLGVVFDFSSREGDHFITASGEPVSFLAPPHPPRSDEKSARPTEPQTGPPTGPPVGPTHEGFTSNDAGNGQTTLGDFHNLTRMDVDLDKDGVADGYVLVAFRVEASGAQDPLAALGTPINVLGVDPSNPNRVLLDIDADNVADGSISARFLDAPKIVITSQGLFDPDPFGS